MNPLPFRPLAALSALLLGLAALPAWSQTAAPAPAPATAAGPTSKLVGTYTEFAGSPENAAALVKGLRTGTPITLTQAPAPGAPPPTATTFTAPTRPMGYGNIKIALALAQNQLASQGVTNPTPQQLQGALVGTTTVNPNGTTTTTQGVLQMRASGMGWGQIANSMGVKLGAVMSGKAAAAPTTAYGAGSGAGTSKSSGVTTAAGSSGSGRGNVVTGAGSSSHGRSGITTAAGAGSGVSTGHGHAYGHGGGAGGVVTAAGPKGAGNSNAGGGQGKGGGKP